jgi:hypothetical protein
MNRPVLFLKLFLGILSLALFISCHNAGTNQNPDSSTSLYKYQNVETRWSSFENPTADKGKGAMVNNGAKGHPCDQISAGESVVLLNVGGPGIIKRMWFTIYDRSPEMLRSLTIQIYWDGCSKPAVSAPFGDFFCVGPGQDVSFQNDLFASPEGKSFNCFVPMPFNKSAKVVVQNESKNDLLMMFYDIDFIKVKKLDRESLYFHTYWHRDTLTALGKDFEILPRINGRGRFLGTYIMVKANSAYEDHWWGEGEVKMYIDGDNKFPTLAGTGTEDYVGTGWGLEKFATSYSGCLIADRKNRTWSFYRFHIPDPVFFKNDIKVTIQQIGGHKREVVMDLLHKGVNLIPITFRDVTAKRFTMYPLLASENKIDISDSRLLGNVNYYRSDDYSATSFFYLDKPENDLPELQALGFRLYRLK